MNWYKIIHTGSAKGRTTGIINTEKMNNYLSITVIEAKDLISAKRKARNFTDVKEVKRIFK